LLFTPALSQFNAAILVVLNYFCVEVLFGLLTLKDAYCYNFLCFVNFGFPKARTET